LTFDVALERLEALAQQLENGDIPLEDALEVYERAVSLFRHCRTRLEGVEQRLETLTRDLDGEPVATAIEPGGHGELDG
jgi:exodeoxyribonuclease VII small subunit